MNTMSGTSDVVEININDVTLREGDQAPLTSFTKEEKQIIALMLGELGIKNIEVGFGASRADGENIEGVKVMFSDMENQPFIASLGRATEGDTEASLNVLKGYKNPRIHIFMATSDEHVNAKFSKCGDNLKEKRDWLKEKITNEISRAKRYKDEHNNNLEIEFSPEDATGNALTKKENGKKYLNFESDEFNFLIECIEIAIRKGATIINAPDTLGNLLPHQTELFFKELVKRTEYLKNEGFNFEFSCHIHNDLALASANAISAIRGGVTQVEVTIDGIGERAGNTPLHELIGIISKTGHVILDDGREVVLHNSLQTKLVGPVTRFVSSILALNNSLQEPFIGALSNVDGSGVHNANQKIYGGSKDKKMFGGASIEEFFSPRGGVNQIVSMLSRYGINEDKSGEIIQKLTKSACKKAEKVKALYGANIYSMYLQEKGDFSIGEIEINGNCVSVTITINGNTYTIKGCGEGNNGVIDGIINGINVFLGEEIVSVEGIKIVNKPSLNAEVNKFNFDASKSGVELSREFKDKVNDILNNSSGNGYNSKQLGVSHVDSKVGKKYISTVGTGYNVSKASIRAIIDGALPMIIEKAIKL